MDLSTRCGLSHSQIVNQQSTIGHLVDRGGFEPP